MLARHARVQFVPLQRMLLPPLTRQLAQPQVCLCGACLRRRLVHLLTESRTPLTSPDSRPGDGVGLHVLVGVRVDVDVNFRVGHLVHAGDRSQVGRGRDAGAAAGDGQVCALWIPGEMSAMYARKTRVGRRLPLRGVARVQSDGLVADEVVASLEVLRDGHSLVTSRVRRSLSQVQSEVILNTPMSCRC